MHDARYDYLGREDYIKLSDKLLRERNEHGLITTGKEWIKIQRDLLISHEFKTATAKMLRSITAQDQIKALDIYAD